MDHNEDIKTGLGTQEQMEKDPHWNGIPPVGNKPIHDKYKFLIFILVVFIVKIIIWSAYRWTTGNWDVLGNPVNNYTAGIFMKPLLQLLPVFILWIYLFKEKGLPFRLTRKHLFSSIVFGCILGLVYYFVATGVLVGIMGATGQGTDFHIVAGWDDVGWGLIIAMMFSYMIGTGPTEELFSRGFLQDQSARAFPIWFAILFSSVLFAIGHLPISIFLYHMSLMAIVWYMIILVVMGGFFSLLYLWSRNIVFPIIIHGLWDWYLSLYALRGAYSKGFMADPVVNFGVMDFVSTIITLCIMLPIFYIVYLVWWRHDKPLQDGPLAGIVRAIEQIRVTAKIRKYDRGAWPRGNPILVTAAIVGIFCLLSIPLAAVVSTDDPAKFNDRMIGAEQIIVFVYDNGTIQGSNLLNEGKSFEYPIEFIDMEIEYINITLTWQDDPGDSNIITNEPDEFKVELFDNDGFELAVGQGDSGNLELSWQGVEAVEYTGNFMVVVTLEYAGDLELRYSPFGLISQPDDSNDYSLEIEYTMFTKEYIDIEDGDVRWEE